MTYRPFKLRISKRLHRIPCNITIHNVCRNMLLPLYLSASQVTNFVASLDIFFRYVSLLYKNQPFMCPVTKLAGHIDYYTISSLALYNVLNHWKKILCSRNSFLVVVFITSFLLQPIFFHRLRTHLVISFNRLFLQLLNVILKFFIWTNEFTGILEEYKGMLLFI